MKCFEITADYRPLNKNRPRYHVYAENKADAVIAFKRLYNLTVYGAREMTDEEVDALLARGPKYYPIEGRMTE